MRASFEYRLGRDEYVVGVQALTAELAKLDTNAPRHIIERLGAVTAALLLVTYFYPESFVGLIVASFVILIVEMVLLPRRLRKVTGQSYDPAIADLRVDLTDEAVEETAAGRRRQWGWTAVRRIHERGSAIVIELAGWDMVVLPSRLWSDEDGKARFVEEARARVPEGASGGLPSADAVPLDVNELQLLAALVAGLTPFFLMGSLLPAFTERYGAVADRIGLVGGMTLLLLLSAAAGYPVYRLARRGFPRLHARHPRIANLLAQLLVVVVPFYLAATCAGLL
jgi:hypothetical protein